ELAPVAALIQRMGRCNRRSPVPPGRVGEGYVVEPENEAPYHTPGFEGELAAAREFVGSLNGRDVSQADLDAAYREVDPGRPEPERSCRFLDSGPYALAGEGSFRDIEEFTTPCVLESDVDEVLARVNSRPRRPFDGLVVPVPRGVVRAVGRPGDGGLPG